MRFDAFLKRLFRGGAADEAIAPPTTFNCGDQGRPSWMQRADLAVRMLATTLPDRKRLEVADVGCGDQKFRGALESAGIKHGYQGFDLVPQAPDVSPFDVSHDDLPGKFDVVVMMGVIEYLPALSQVLSKLSRQGRYLLVSHVIRQGNKYSDEALAKLGWVNHVTLDELKALLQQAGFELMQVEMTPDRNTAVLLCQSSNGRKSQ